MAWFACHPNHSIWREIGVCVHMWGHLVCKSCLFDCTQAHHSISHLNKCAIMLGHRGSKPQCSTAIQKPALDIFSCRVQAATDSCAYRGQSNTNNSSAWAQNYSWEGSFCVSQLWCLYFISARLAPADNERIRNLTSHLSGFLAQYGQSGGVQGCTGNQVRACSITTAKQKLCLRPIITLWFLLPTLIAVLMRKNYRGQKYPGRVVRIHHSPECHQL